MMFELKIGYNKIKERKQRRKETKCGVKNFAGRRTLSLKKEKTVFSIN